MAEVCVVEGSTVEVGTVLARLSPVGRAGLRAGPVAGEDDVASGVAEIASPAPPARSASAYHSPVVSRLAAEHGVDLSSVVGAGRGGRVRKQDVLAAAAAERPLHIESPYRGEAPAGQLSRMRRAIGAHMKRSLETAATCTTWMEADMSRVEASRRRAKASSLVGVTALAIVARCAMDALAEHPALNATLEGERYTRHDAVHLGVAVSLGEDGLIVPVIRDAHALSVEQLGVTIRELARRARTQQLSPDEVHGGTFTITNPGPFGSLISVPIINQPQTGILGFDTIEKRPVVIDDTIAIRHMVYISMSWDHRVIDGALASQFLARVKQNLETWDFAEDLAL
jgi:pyruvate/2-oxoglutarate dehydrogenase complex dihydrolipoamide acyltransferase (E2) component